MTKTTLSEETQELLDEVYDVELALEFIENHGETEFLTYYEKYEELVKEYGQNLIDEFAEHYDVDTCLLYTSPSPRDKRQSRMPSSA